MWACQDTLTQRLRPQLMQQLDINNRTFKKRRREVCAMQLAARCCEKIWILFSIPLPRTSVCVCCFGMFPLLPEPRGVSSPCSLINTFSPPEKMAQRHRSQSTSPTRERAVIIFGHSNIGKN